MKSCEGGSLQQRDGGVRNNPRTPNAILGTGKEGRFPIESSSYVFVRSGRDETPIVPNWLTPELISPGSDHRTPVCHHMSLTHDP